MFFGGFILGPGPISKQTQNLPSEAPYPDHLDNYPLTWRIEHPTWLVPATPLAFQLFRVEWGFP